MRPTVKLLPLLFLALAVGLLGSTGCQRQTKPLSVTYYYVPGAPASDAVQPAVTGLEKEFPGKVAARSVDATSRESKQLMDTLGFRTHGIVIHGRRGELLWKQQEVNIEEVRQQVRDLLAQHDTA